MGLRFRKSIKIAPGVKVNLNKNSTSVSVGTKGKHYTVNSKGKTTTTVGIPGTGLSYSTTSSSTKPQKTSKKTKVSTVKKSNEKTSKPKKKSGCLTSCLVVFVALILIFAMVPSGDKKDDDKNPLGFDVDFSSSYRNDVTGRWRLAKITEHKPVEEYALDYYHNYFESDDEVHIIINFTLNTTNRILVFGNLLDVATMEYVDKEEHDAKIACSGMLLSEYLINIDTGEAEKIQPSTVDDSPAENIEDIPDINTEQTEQERIAAEQAEAERIAQEQAEAERIAAEQAEAERVAQEQAEAERIAAEQAEAQRIAQEQAEAQRIAQEQASQQQNVGQMVWISETGSKYHSIPNCGRMNPDKAYQMPLSDAQANGYGACSKCH